MPKEIKTLIDILKGIRDKNTKAVILQLYISENGPVPDAYSDEIRNALAN